MIEKLIVPEELAPRRKPAWRAGRASILTVTGIALLLFVGRTVGTADERPTTIQGTAPVPFDPSAASGSGSDPTSTDQTGSIGISGPGQGSPGQWLIDDIATNRAASELKGGRPNPIPPMVATPVAAEASVGLRALDRKRAGKGQRRRAEVTGSIGKPPASDEHGASIRPNTSVRLDNAAPTCAQAPGGLAPEGEQWHYHLDHKTQRKCWYARGPGQDGGRRRRSMSDPPGAAAPSGTDNDSRWVWH
jgi:hypothetical protein